VGLAAVIAVGLVGCRWGHPPAATPGAVATPAMAPGRYLYQPSCDAHLEKFDTETNRKVGDYDLTQRSGSPPLVPAGPAVLEVCLTNHPVFDCTNSILYTAVPVDLRAPSGVPVSYRVLGFSIPEIVLVKRLPPSVALDHAPHLVLRPAAEPQLMSEADWNASAEETLVDFTPDHRALPNRVLETSGERVLLRLFATDGSPVLAVADRTRKTLVRLGTLPAMAIEHSHLVPGGSYVIVEDTQVARPGSAGSIVKTGKVRLYDATTGTFVTEFSDPHVARLVYRGISPRGQVLYQLGSESWLLNLGLTFPAIPVVPVRADDFPPPTLFFADR